MTQNVRARSFGHPEVFAMIGIASFVAARFLDLLSIPYVCPAKALFRIPCPSCGMTHAFVFLAHGRPSAAFWANPAGALLALCAWGFAVFDLGRLLLGKQLPRVPMGVVRLAIFFFAAVLLSSWVYLLATGGGR